MKRFLLWLVSKPETNRERLRKELTSIKYWSDWQNTLHVGTACMVVATLGLATYGALIIHLLNLGRFWTVAKPCGISCAVGVVIMLLLEWWGAALFQNERHTKNMLSRLS